MILYAKNPTEVWSRVAPLLQKALDRSNGEMLLEDVFERLMDGRQQLLIAVMGDRIVAAFVTEVIEYPRKRALRLVLGGGAHLYDWIDELNEFMDLGAQAVGANLIEVHGRMGWMRVLKKRYDMKTETVLMTRKVQ